MANGSSLLPFGTLFLFSWTTLFTQLLKTLSFLATWIFSLILNCPLMKTIARSLWSIPNPLLFVIDFCAGVPHNLFPIADVLLPQWSTLVL